MARQFTSADVSRLATEHKDYIDRLSEGESAPEQYRLEIVETAKALAAEEVIKILREIPVEEINRDKRGFRVKALRDYGFSTIADLSVASVYNIASVRGISQSTAYSIKKVVDEFVNQARSETKIRLSTDNKKSASTRLVTAVSKYRHSLLYAESCHKMLEQYSNDIHYSLEDIKPGKSGFRWFFTSKLKKQRALEAYNFLENLLSDEYGKEVRETINGLNSVSTISGSSAWNDFSENSIQFFNVLEDVSLGILGTDDSVYGLPEDLAREIQDECFFPDGLLCELCRYQEWGVKYILH